MLDSICFFSYSILIIKLSNLECFHKVRGNALTLNVTLFAEIERTSDVTILRAADIGPDPISAQM